MKKLYFLILTLFCLVVNGAICMDSKKEDGYSLNLINKSFSLLPSEGKGAPVLVVAHKGTLKDIFPIPGYNKTCTFYIKSVCFGEGLSVQLGQLDNDHFGIHSEIPSMQVFNNSTGLSDSFTITFEGFSDRSRAFTLTSKLEGNLLRSIRSVVQDLILKILAVDGALSAEQVPLFGENLFLLSVVLSKTYPQMQITSDKNLGWRGAGPGSQSF
jgi:hypothetical protein